MQSPLPEIRSDGRERCFSFQALVCPEPYVTFVSLSLIWKYNVPDFGDDLDNSIISVLITSKV